MSRKAVASVAGAGSVDRVPAGAWGGGGSAAAAAMAHCRSWCDNLRLQDRRQAMPCGSLRLATPRPQKETPGATRLSRCWCGLLSTSSRKARDERRKNPAAERSAEAENATFSDAADLFNGQLQMGDRSQMRRLEARGSKADGHCIPRLSLPGTPWRGPAGCRLAVCHW